MKLSLKLILGASIAFLLCITQVWALSLGNLNVISAVNKPFEARINLKLSDTESLSLRNLEVTEADPSVYQKLGIASNNSGIVYSIKLIKNSEGVPEFISLSSPDSINSTNSLFKDVVIQVKWDSGLIRRVYTILSDKKISVVEGETLGEIAEKLRPDVGGASFDQTLIALYRINPQAFVSGNIHRLKAGASLQIPSEEMIKSIPIDESRNIVGIIGHDYQKGISNKSTEDITNTPKIEKSINSKNPDSDRLNIRSSDGKNSIDEQIANQVEELVAQEKLLADAKQRIAELEKNIADLKSISSKSKESNFFDTYKVELKILISLLILSIVAFVTFQILRARNIKLANSYKERAIHSVENEDKGQNKTALPEDAKVSSERAKALFAGIDLNLTAPVDIKNRVKKSTSAELRVKLNLAKSYLKIDDIVMAKLILDEILADDLSVSDEISKEARHLRSNISI